MSEIITAENTELLTSFLTDVYRKSYLAAALNLQESLKDGIENGEVQKADISVVNHFSKGVYLREFRAKAGTLVVSKMHKTEHYIIFLTGSASIATDQGVELINAPFITKTVPGVKRVAYFHKDSSCITIHPTELTDVDEIENEIIVPDGKEEEFLNSIGRSIKELISCHGQQ